MLEAVKNLHLMAKVHLDIKPENFRITKDHVVKLFDFGISMDYIVDDKHKPFGVYSFQGSPFWASINAHKGYALSRRDDLESLGYSILSLSFPELITWRDVKDNEEIMKVKEE